MLIAVVYNNLQEQGTTRGRHRNLPVRAIGLNKSFDRWKLSTSRFSVFRFRRQRAHTAHRKLHCVRTDQSRDCRHWTICAFQCRVDRLHSRLDQRIHQTGKTSC